MTLDPNHDQRRAADPTVSAWVGASAGTGKTKVLVDRVLGLLLAQNKPEPHRLLCLTFTKAAAAEMSDRIATVLAEWSVMDEAKLVKHLDALTGVEPSPETCDHARRLFAHLLDAPGGMRIETIHAFCQSLLRRFPVEAGVSPHFEVMDDRDAAETMLEARDEVLAHASREPDSALAHAVARITSRVHETKFSDFMSDLVRERGKLRRLLARPDGAAAAIADLRERLGVGPKDTEPRVIAHACKAVDEDRMKELMLTLLTGSKMDVEKGDNLANWLAADEATRQNTFFTTYTRAFLTQDYQPFKKFVTKAVTEAAPDAPVIMAEEAERLLQVRDHVLSVNTAENTAALLTFAEALLDAYGAAKTSHAVMDYDDLIFSARALLETQGAAAWVLYKLDGGIDHVLVDEAQDTNPDQWAVFQALTEDYFSGLGAREPGERTVFAVGDRKQSIYSFQGADPRAFDAQKSRVAARATEVGAGFESVDLHISFRSTRAVLDVVDRVFKTDPGRDGVASEGEDITHIPHRAKAGGLVELWPPEEPEEKDAPPPWKPPVERVTTSQASTRLAERVARRIHAMITKGEILESKGRPIRARDIMVLVRRRGGFVEDLVRSLKKLGVETAGADRMTLTDQMAVMDLIALGEFLLLPQDDLTLAAVLKGPLVGLSEDDLFTLAYDRKGGLWDALCRRAGEATVFGCAHRELEDVLARADFTPPHELFAHVLGRLGGRRKLLARLGPEAEDPIDEFLNLIERNR